MGGLEVELQRRGILRWDGRRRMKISSFIHKLGLPKYRSRQLLAGLLRQLYAKIPLVFQSRVRFIVLHFIQTPRLLNLLYRNLFASSIYSMSASITISTIMIHSVPSGRFLPAHRSARFGSTQYLSKIAHLALDQKRVAGHLFWLGESHSLQDRWRNISKDTISLLQRPALWSVGHDEWDLVSGVGSLWLSILELHLLSVAVIELAC